MNSPDDLLETVLSRVEMSHDRNACLHRLCGSLL